MNNNLVHRLPGPNEDVEKWFKFFSKRNLYFIIPGLMTTFILFKIFMSAGYAMIGVIIGFVFTIALGFISFFKVDSSKYLTGADLTLDVILARKYIRYRNRAIYILGIEEQ